MAWNPSAPSSLGLEWVPTTPLSVQVNSDNTAASYQFVAATTRVVTAIDMISTVYTGGRVAIEVYTLADWLATASDAVTVASFAPTADVNYSGWTTPAAPFWDDVDDDPYAASDTDYAAAAAPANAYLRSRFGGLTLASGRRPLQLRFVSRVYFPGTYNPFVPYNVQLRQFMDAPTGNQYTIAYHQNAQMPMAYQQLYQLEGTATINPNTGAPWLQGELASWGTTGSFGSELVSTNESRLYAHRLYLDHVVERRLAWAIPYVTPPFPVPASGNPKQRIQSATYLGTPSGATSFTITSGTTYVVVVRRLGLASVGLPLIKPVPPHVGTMAYQDFVRPDGRLMNTTSGRAVVYGAYPVVTLVGSTVDGDMNPYHSLVGLLVNSTTTARQVITTTTAGSYSVVRALVAGGPVGTALAVSIRRRTDGVLMGAHQITRAEWDAAPTATATAYLTQPLGGAARIAKHMMVVLPSAATLAAATDYFVDFETSNTSTDEAAAWQVAVLQADASHQSGTYGASGFGATTYQGVVYNGWDLPVMVQLQPTAPASVVVTQVPVQLSDADGTGDNDGIWNTAKVAWAKTSLGVTFLRYEIQRYDYGDPVPSWQTIGTLSAEDVAITGPVFYDYEGRRGVAADYRVRVVRTDTATSVWVTATGSPFTPAARTCGVGFVVNGAAGLIRAVYQDIEPLRQWDVIDETTYRQLYNADYQVAFQSVEERGVRFSMRLLVYSGNEANPDVPGSGLYEFDRLRAVARQSGVPYVAVIDNDGGRVLAALQVGQLSEHVQAQVYTVGVTATQVASEPVVAAF